MQHRPCGYSKSKGIGSVFQHFSRTKCVCLEILFKSKIAISLYTVTIVGCARVDRKVFECRHCGQNIV